MGVTLYFATNDFKESLMRKTVILVESKITQTVENLKSISAQYFIITLGIQFTYLMDILNFLNRKLLTGFML